MFTPLDASLGKVGATEHRHPKYDEGPIIYSLEQKAVSERNDNNTDDEYYL